MIIAVSIIAIVLLAATIILNLPRFGKLPNGARLERIKHSPNYRNGEFQNQSPTPTFSGETNKFKVFLDFLFGEKTRVTPVDSIPSIKTDMKNVDPDQDLMVWFGHSSYFMQIDGKRILVDPVFSGYVAPFSWMVNAFKGANSYRAADMPGIDYLFITHDHWDHLDYNTMLELKPKTKKVICGLGVGSHLEYWGFDPKSIIELDWHEHSTLDSGWVVNATPARHFSGRGLKRNQTLWASFVLQTPTMKIFIAGDGGYDKHFAEIGEKFGPFDLAILEQGQFNTRWRYIHMMPDEVFKAAHELKAKRLMPVHNSKFALSVHPWDEPLIKLVENGKGSQIQVLTPMIGEPINLKDTTQLFSHWWKNLN